MPKQRQVVAVATSGGRDSTALLHAVTRHAASANIGVVALHVHHGLHPDADGWLKHLRAQCKRWARQGLPLSLAYERLSSRPAAGESIEAWARRERYAALARMARAHGAHHVLLAHHRGDQAETVFLQALRGAGPAGLAAMPSTTERDGLVWLRPWLLQPRTAVEAYVKRWRLSHIDDGSNQDAKFDRNRLRLSVWPELIQGFPNAEQALCEVARQAASADAFIREMAALLLAPMLHADGLDAQAWRQLSVVQRHWVLRHWLTPLVPSGLGHAALTRLEREALTADAGRWPLGGGQELRLYRGRFSLALRCEPGSGASVAGLPAVPWPATAAPGEWCLPQWGGTLVWRPVNHGGVSVAVLLGARLRARTGGERFQQGPNRPTRPLKKQYQALGVPEWARHGPLVWQGERLLFVSGLGMDARCWATEGEPQLVLQWHPDPAGIVPSR